MLLGSLSPTTVSSDERSDGLRTRPGDDHGGRSESTDWPYHARGRGAASGPYNPLRQPILRRSNLLGYDIPWGEGSDPRGDDLIRLHGVDPDGTREAIGPEGRERFPRHAPTAHQAVGSETRQ